MKFDIVEDEGKELELATKGNSLVETAKEFNVIDQASEQAAINFKAATKGLIKQITEYWKEPIEQANRLHKNLTQKRKTMLEPCESAESIIDSKIKPYRLEQMRIEEERKRQAEKERREREEAERQRLLAEAVKAEAEGKAKENIDAIIEEAESFAIIPDVVESVLEKSVTAENGKKVSHVKDIKIQITDEMKLLRAILSGQFPETFIDVNIPKIKTWMKANGITSYNQDGILVSEDLILRVR